MNKVKINLDALTSNLDVVGSWMDRHGASWCLVTKALCGHEESLTALYRVGVRSIADSRLDNLLPYASGLEEVERCYLRLPDLSVIDEVVRMTDISLNSESVVIRELSKAACANEKPHNVIIMVELGDLREGILPGTLLGFYERVFELPGIRVLGLGAQLGCLAGAIPTVDQFTQVALYRELLELKFGKQIPFISAGTSVALPGLVEGIVPAAVNHFRVGEAVFLGPDLVHGGTMEGLRDDVIEVEAEIAEITEKGLVPMCEVGAQTPFTGESQDECEPHVPGERAHRALITLGELDTDVAGLTPVDPTHRIAGSSSDITVVNIGENPDRLKVGDRLSFRPSYSAFVRLMSSQYVEREVNPPLSDFPGRQVRAPRAVTKG